MGKLIFTAITSEGGLLPSDFLQTLLSPGSSVPGMEEVSYHLAKGERVTEAVNRSWNRLKGCWENYQRALVKKNEGEPTTTETRDRWLLPLFQELGFGTLAPVRSIEIEGKSYPVSHGWGPVPIHLVGSHVDIDRRTPGAVGASRISPHSLVQQLLNASDDHLWGIVSNGMNLRLLRDNAALTRLAYVEWDLQAIFDADVYPEFLLLWLVCHQSRFEGDKPEVCLLEQWKKAAQEKGLRALENLRPGVEKAITSLGEGLVGHKSNRELRRRLSIGELTTQDFYWQILRVVYRMLFLFVAEDRDLLHVPIPEHAAPDEEKAFRVARERYLNYYSITRLRSLSLSRAGTPHPDLWQAFVLVCGILGSDNGSPELALPALGSFLWTEKDSTPDLKGCLVSNRKFLDAVHAVAFVQDRNVRRAVDYRNLGAEELGSVYESLLELHPLVNADAGIFELRTAAGHERKTTGSYYTPDSLVQCLLDSALEPVMADAIRGKKDQEAVEAILNLKVCDPAVGSGHFLIAAAHRMAKKVAALSTGEEEPAPAAVRVALRDVIGHCLYGVDVNPMAAELCRVSLWMEALVPGKPLTFLDHHIQVGNSLLGATPELIAKGIPDEAFTAIEGDDKKACSVLRKRNKEEKKTVSIEHAEHAEMIHEQLRKSSLNVEMIPDESLLDIRKKETTYEIIKSSEEYKIMKLLADTWCAAFVIRKKFKNPDDPKSAMGITQRYLDEVALEGMLSDVMIHGVFELTTQYNFFHWHLAFPEVFKKGGFDCILGNPPWERVKLQEREWFAEYNPDIAQALNAASRERQIKSLKINNPALYQLYLDALRKSEGESHFIRHSCRYQLCGRGDINLYAVFAEVFLSLVNSTGYSSAILPCGIATDDTTKYFFQHVVDSQRLYALFGFINEEMLFPSVLHNFKFCILVLSGIKIAIDRATIVFNSYNVEQSKDEARRFYITSKEISLLNPNTRTCPVFFWRHSAEITKAIYRRFPVIQNDNGINEWSLKLGSMFHMSNDSGLFTTDPDSDNELMPLYEAKMIDQYNHRFASHEHLQPGQRSHMLPEVENHKLDNPYYKPQPCYYVKACDVHSALPNIWTKKWLVGFREITSAGLWRTTIYSVLPMCGVSNKIPLVFFAPSCIAFVPSYLACMNSFVLDFVSRQKLGGATYNFFIKRQLPLPRPSVFNDVAYWNQQTTFNQWISNRVIELVYTDWDLQSFAYDYGWTGPPFRWDDERRFLLRCELDAAYFHIYLQSTIDGQWKQAHINEGAVCNESLTEFDELKLHFPTPKDAVIYIMDTFPIVKRKDEDKYKEYRTKRVILEVYDEMYKAMRTGKSYQTRLNPPPADPSCCHPPKWSAQK